MSTHVYTRTVTLTARRLAARPLAARRLAAASAGCVLGAILLVGCVSTHVDDPTSGASDSTFVATPSPTATSASLVPGGTAEDNLPYFRQVVDAVWNGPDRAAGRAYVDALVAAGFDKSAMQVTPDSTPIGNPVESLQFSVRWGDECLIGQVGPATGEAVAVVMPGLDGGGCLIGQTRQIDW